MVRVREKGAPAFSRGGKLSLHPVTLLSPLVPSDLGGRGCLLLVPRPSPAPAQPL